METAGEVRKARIAEQARPEAEGEADAGVVVQGDRWGVAGRRCEMNYLMIFFLRNLLLRICSNISFFNSFSKCHI